MRKEGTGRERKGSGAAVAECARTQPKERGGQDPRPDSTGFCFGVLGKELFQAEWRKTRVALDKSFTPISSSAIPIQDFVYLWSYLILFVFAL